MMFAADLPHLEVIGSIVSPAFERRVDVAVDVRLGVLVFREQMTSTLHVYGLPDGPGLHMPFLHVIHGTSCPCPYISRTMAFLEHRGNRVLALLDWADPTRADDDLEDEPVVNPIGMGAQRSGQKFTRVCFLDIFTGKNVGCLSFPVLTQGYDWWSFSSLAVSPAQDKIVVLCCQGRLHEPFCQPYVGVYIFAKETHGSWVLQRRIKLGDVDHSHGIRLRSAKFCPTTGDLVFVHTLNDVLTLHTMSFMTPAWTLVSPRKYLTSEHAWGLMEDAEVLQDAWLATDGDRAVRTCVLLPKTQTTAPSNYVSVRMTSSSEGTVASIRPRRWPDDDVDDIYPDDLDFSMLQSSWPNNLIASKCFVVPGLGVVLVCGDRSLHVLAHMSVVRTAWMTCVVRKAKKVPQIRKL
jgi:hypothetical protein